MISIINVFILLKYFLGTLNTVVILAPGREFFCAKCVQSPLTFME